MHGIIKIIEQEKIIGIIRTKTPDDAYQSALAAIQGGLKIVEIALTIPEAYSIIGELSKRKNVLVAAGSVLNAEMAEMTIEAGAKWIISPHTDPEIISYCKFRHTCVAPGALTPNEIYNAWNLGADIVKVFPISSVGGSKHIRTLLGPLPFLKLMPTGTIFVDNALEYLEAGAVAVGLGSSLFDRAAIQAGDFSKITDTTHKFLSLIHNWYDEK